MEQLQIFSLIEAIQANLALVILILLLLLGAVVAYYVLMVRAVLEMLRLDARSVLLVFAFLCLIPFPLLLIYGVVILILWRYHRRDLHERAASLTRKADSAVHNS